jgi:hypothetical protein
VIRKNNDLFVIEIDRSKTMLHLEAEQREAKQSVAEQDNHF